MNKALTRLREVVLPKNYGSTGLKPCAVGTIMKKRISIQKSYLLSANFCKIGFYGVLSETDAGSVLQGSFRLSWFRRIYFSLWLVFILLYALLTATYAYKYAFVYIKLPIFIIFFLFLNISQFCSAWWSAKSESAWITQVITKTLSVDEFQTAR